METVTVAKFSSRPTSGIGLAARPMENGLSCPLGFGIDLLGGAGKSLVSVLLLS